MTCHPKIIATISLQQHICHHDIIRHRVQLSANPHVYVANIQLLSFEMVEACTLPLAHFAERYQIEQVHKEQNVMLLWFNQYMQWKEFLFCIAYPCIHLSLTEKKWARLMYLVNHHSKREQGTSPAEWDILYTTFRVWFGICRGNVTIPQLTRDYNTVLG